MGDVGQLALEELGHGGQEDRTLGEAARRPHRCRRGRGGQAGIEGLGVKGLERLEELAVDGVDGGDGRAGIGGAHPFSIPYVHLRTNAPWPARTRIRPGPPGRG